MEGMKIRGFVHSKDTDGSHQPEAMGGATLIAKAGDNDYIVELEGGVRCHALFNHFCGYWFMDDVYRIVDNPDALNSMDENDERNGDTL